MDFDAARQDLRRDPKITASMCAIRVLDKEPYDYPYLPPFVGEVFPPAEAGFDGHFDQLSAQLAPVPVGARLCLGQPGAGHLGKLSRHDRSSGISRETYERLEIIPWVDWNNAQSGYGYLELGRERGIDGRNHPYALNFDVIAHEVGHAILFSLFGHRPGGWRVG